MDVDPPGISPFSEERGNNDQVTWERNYERELGAGAYALYEGGNSGHCAEPGKQLYRDLNVVTDGNCLFHSFIKLCDLSLTPLELRKELLESDCLELCGDETLARRILESANEYGDVNCVFIFSQFFTKNVCVHSFNDRNEVQCIWFRGNPDEASCWIHLHHVGAHYTPLRPAEPRENVASTENNNYTETVQGNEAEQQPGVRGNSEQQPASPFSRPPREKPPWYNEDQDDPLPFVALNKVREHPFLTDGNLLCLLTADSYLETEALRSLCERRYLKIEDLPTDTGIIGEVLVSERKNYKTFVLFIKNHIDEQPLRINMKRGLKTLRNLMIKLEIKHFGIVHDSEMLSRTEWDYFIETLTTLFQGQEIRITYFLNTLPIPKVEERYLILTTYHCSPVGGHHGINKTYNKIIQDFYWKNMRADVTAFVNGCEGCQINKTQRKKTRLPMLITDTPSRSFDKVAMDFYGPLTETTRGNLYIMTIQDLLTKYIVLIPMAQATAVEVTRAFAEYFISYFGPPASILTDLGRNFQSKSLEEFARIFRINKYRTSAYRPQSNGSIERMHSTLTSFLSQVVQEGNDWDSWLFLGQHSYNTVPNESTGYTPHELVFSVKARTPSSFPSRERLLTFDKYLADLTHNLGRLQTLAAMNMVQAKYRSKSYYDRRLNVKHFREGEMVFLLKEAAGKFQNKYEGPFEIMKIDRDRHNVEIRKGDVTKIAHIDRIKRARERMEPITETPQEQGGVGTE